METAGKQVRAGDPTDDRLSDLPDDLLLHVFSFLRSQQAVQTSVLSKRWKNLWRSMRCIDIKIDVDSRNHGFSYSKEKWKKTKDFMNNLLKFHDSPTLDVFRIYIGSNHEHLLPTIDRWLSGATKYRPLDIQITYYMNGTYKLPHLGSSTALLKKMCLNRVCLDDSFEEQLRSGYPVLEDLTLRDCDTCHFHEIQSTTLRKIVLIDCYRSSKMLVIRAPALVSLTIADVEYRSGVKLDGPMNYLVNALIFPFDREYSHLSQASLLGSLFNVTNLHLVSLSAEVMLDKELDKYPSFMNLKTLSMYGCLHSKTSWVDGCHRSSFDPNRIFKAFARLLHKAPNLERLTLEDCWSLQESMQNMTPSDVALNSLDQKALDCPNLKLIEIKYRGDIDDARKMFQLACGLLRNQHNPDVTFTRIRTTWLS